MDITETLALILWLAVLITIAIELYIRRYRTYLKPKREKSGTFWMPVPFPEDGDDEQFCALCHGRLGGDPLAACTCGNMFHPDCIELENCPRCGNDFRHMHYRQPLMIRCPICIRPAAAGICRECGIVLPHADGTFRCEDCGTAVSGTEPVCRKCGAVYVARTTKGYMDRVRAGRR